MKARGKTAAFVLLAAVLSFALRPQASPSKVPATNPDSLLISSYDKKVAEYLKLRKKEQAGLPALKSTDSSQQISEHQRLLASKIRAARPQAGQGEIFSPEVSQLFKRLIAAAYQAANPAKVTASLRHDEPVSDLRLRVYGDYPETVPLQTTPASILLNLPPLPPELEYRIVGQNLVLRDRGANIIVDYIVSAIPRS